MKYINNQIWQQTIMSLDRASESYLSFPVSITNITHNKRMVNTAVESGSGNVIEFNGIEPKTFTMDFKIIGKNSNSFQNQLQELQSFLDAEQPIYITNPILSRWGISQIIIESMSSYTQKDYYAEGSLDCMEFVVATFTELNPTGVDAEILENLGNEKLNELAEML